MVSDPNLKGMAVAHISEILAALHNEVSRIATEQAGIDKSDELEAVLLESIHRTLVEIKEGADSDDFADLTVANFIIAAAEADYSTPSIDLFVSALKDSHLSPEDV